MNIQKIFISGSVQSGKATFGYLLDGHPNILCNIIHDQLINSIKHLQQFCNNDFKKTRENDDKRNEKNIFCKSKRFNKEKEISIYDLREAIFKSNLHHIERLAFLKIILFIILEEIINGLNLILIMKILKNLGKMSFLIQIKKKIFF